MEAPSEWTEFMYDLSAYDGQNVYIAIRCVSNDAFVFYVDNFNVHSNGGGVSNNDINSPVAFTELKGNYPNPFNPETTIRYSVKEAGPVAIEIYNLKGQLVNTLVNKEMQSGQHSVVWNGKDASGKLVSSGLYFTRVENVGKAVTRKILLSK